jgi:TrmH family RNA methyltransferase
MKKWKNNISFVLVEPQDAGNIGSSARALKNMGFSRLSLVNPVPLTDETRRLAHNAPDVIRAATVYTDLSEALKKQALVVGTTRRKGKRRGLIYNVDDGAKKIVELASTSKVAILFGREDRGLYNEEVEECGFMLSIPANVEHPSLNLSQAVLVVAYELSRAEYRKPASDSRVNEVLVSHEELKNLYGRIQETLVMLEYLPKGDRDLAKKMMMNIKHFIGRAGLTDWELKMLHGICTRIERKINTQS